MIIDDDREELDVALLLHWVRLNWTVANHWHRAGVNRSEIIFVNADSKKFSLSLLDSKKR